MNSTLPILGKGAGNRVDAMRIEVKEGGLDASEPLRDYAGLRLMSVLYPLLGHVHSVRVSVIGVNGGDAELASRCRMLAVLVPAGEVLVDVTDVGPHAAIDGAAKDLGNALRLHLARRQMTAQARGERRAWVGDQTAIRVRSRGFEFTEALRAYTERRLRRLSVAFQGRMRSVVVRLDDMNGPRGGNDKRCQIVVQLTPRGNVRVEDRSGDAYAAIASAVDRLKRVLARVTERQQWAGRVCVAGRAIARG